MNKSTLSDRTKHELEAEAALRPFLTDKFLAVLKTAAQVCGYTLDFTEVEAFCQWCHETAGKKYGELEDFDFEHSCVEEIKKALA